MFTACTCGLWHREGVTCPTEGRSAAAITLTMAPGRVTASAVSRVLAGPLVKWGQYGRTSAGKLKVKPGALRFPTDLTRVKLTKEHKRDESRGYLLPDGLVINDEGIRASTKVADGPEGDAALAEAEGKIRDGFSFDVVDAIIEGDTITDAEVIAIGQVGIPAYADMRIDTIAASAAVDAPKVPAPPNPERNSMNEEQTARLAELRAKDSLTAEEVAELEALVLLEAQDSATASAEDPPAEDPPKVTASVPAVPSGTRPRKATTTKPVNALADFVGAICNSLRPGGQPITAALSDITHGGAGANIEAPAWSAELWSGLQYEPRFTGLLNSGDLTSFEGVGWRFVTKPVIADYAGDKAAIPSGAVTTESSSYEAARMAVGHDIDRKFYDFPNEGFLSGYLEAVRESWAVKLDAKVHAWIVANAMAWKTGGLAETGTPETRTTVLKSAALAARAVERRTRSKATFILLSDADFDTLMDVNAHDVPAFLDLFNIDPGNFTSSELLTPGQVLAGVKQTATVRTLPGSPIRVSAQNIANAGVDEGFFGYWAIEEHHTKGISSVLFDATP